MHVEVVAGLSTHSDFDWLVGPRAPAPIQVRAPKILEVLLALTSLDILHARYPGDHDFGLVFKGCPRAME